MSRLKTWYVNLVDRMEERVRNMKELLMKLKSENCLDASAQTDASLCSLSLTKYVVDDSTSKFWIGITSAILPIL